MTHTAAFESSRADQRQSAFTLPLSLTDLSFLFSRAHFFHLYLPISPSLTHSLSFYIPMLPLSSPDHLTHGASCGSQTHCCLGACIKHSSYQRALEPLHSLSPSLKLVLYLFGTLVNFLFLFQEFSFKNFQKESRMH